MTRKVTLSAAEVKAAKANNIKLEDVAKAKLPKRGRPAGSKNKAKPVPQSAAKKASVKEQPQVDWRGLAQKLQNALGKAYADNQQLDKHITLQGYQLTIKQKRVDELEFLLAGAVLEGDFDFEDDDE